MNLEEKLKYFKSEITSKYLRLDPSTWYTITTWNNHITKYNNESDRDQFLHILLITNRLKLVKAREDVLPYMKYGLLFNGGNIVYYTEEANQLSKEKFHDVLLFNVMLFISGAYIRNNDWCVNTAALILAHYQLIHYTPKYSQSQRSKLIDQHFGSSFEFFSPAKGIKDFFLNEYVNGRVEFPEDSMFKYKNVGDVVFETAIGTILHIECKMASITKGSGLLCDTHTLKTAFLKEDGVFRQSSLRRSETKELQELKRVYDTLVGEE